MITVLLLAILSATLPAQAGLLSFWPFDDGSGTNAVDVVGARNGTLTNMESGDWITGHNGTGYALNLDGSGEYVSYGNSAALNLTKTSPFSAQSWVYIGGSATTAGVLGTIDPSFPFDGWGLVQVYNYAADNQYRLRFELTSTSGEILKITGPVTTSSAWHHVAATYTGSDSTGGMKLYIDGVPVSVTSDANVAGGALPNNQLATSGSYGGVNRFFNGRVDEPAIWSETLTDGKVMALYSLDQTSPFKYNALTSQSLFDLFTAATGSLTIGGYTWTYSPTLSSALGTVTSSGSQYLLRLAGVSSGAGLTATPVPEPGTFSMLMLGCLGLISASRCRRA